MKYLVVSDNHGVESYLEDIRDKWTNEVDYFFHCGDSELSPDHEIWSTFEVVKGNCDYYSDYDTVKLIETKEDNILLTHGHLFNVNMTAEKLLYQAEEMQANIILYGHTHQLFATMLDDILLLNPGSISQPRGKYSYLKTYAIITHQSDGYLVEYYNEKHLLQDELTHFFSMN